MFVLKHTYDSAYASIVSNARKAISTKHLSTSASTVLILLSLDVDALCAAKILARLLTDDCIGFKLVPIPGWTQLSRIHQEQISGNTDLRSLVLINLGSLIDLTDYFGPLPPQTTLHVIDSHRPWNLNNIFASGPEADQIVVWDDGDIDEDLKEERIAYQTIAAQPDSDSESESDSDSDNEPGPSKRRRHRSRTSDAESDSDEASEAGRRKRKRRRVVDEDGNEVIQNSEDRQLYRKERARHRARLDKYYNAGTYYGQSAAFQMYQLVTMLERTDNDFLWHAIMGLTHQFTGSQIDRERYDGYIRSLSDEVARLNINHEVQLTGVDRAVTGPADRSIRPSEELRFLLFRHWNLYEAMFHSGYVAGKLKLWRERGRKNLQGLLAKMGFSLAQCHQTYIHMDIELKQMLRAKVEALAPEYGLFELAYASFVRAAGYQSVMSASDAVEAVGALLEVGTSVRLDFGKDGGFKSWGAYVNGEEDKENQAPAYAVNNANATRPANISNTLGPRAAQELSLDAEKESKTTDEWWRRNFWLAWNALGQDGHHMRNALTLSMALHRAVIRQGTSMLDKQAVKTLRTFRLAVIREGPDMGVFMHPSTLARLATWLVDAIRDLVDKDRSSRSRKSLPFVIACLDDKSDAYLVVGINGAAEFGDVRKNRFGLAFQEASQVSGARTRHDDFEAAVLEVRKDDLQGFLDRLHLALN